MKHIHATIGSSIMRLNNYQKKIGKNINKFSPKGDLGFHIIGLASEMGEVAGKYKKFLRDGTSYKDLQADIHSELGDVLWYVAAIASDFNLDLDMIAEGNLLKIASRSDRGVVEGSGDDR